jgi:predicted TPR repeat methyltransferase
LSGSGETLQQAMSAHRAGQLEDAEAGYLRCLADQPDDPDALHFLGLLRLHQERPDEAIDLVTRSVIVLPSNPHAWNNLGNLLLNAGRDEEALAAWERAANLAPDMVQAIYNIGVILRKRRRVDDAIDTFMRVIAANPSYAPAYENLASLLYRMGRTEDVATVYRRWLEVDPDNPIARHMATAAAGVGEKPDRADAGYLTTTYDEFADSFDFSLQRLDYAAPQLIAAALGEHVDFGRRSLDILDAGCGTGLCGLLLRSSARRLVGVDLSRAMLEKANQREIYDELVQADLCEFMRGRPADFDVVVSGDTLIYFGALDEALATAMVALRPAGTLAFTLETAPPDSEEGFVLLANGRYAHAKSYIEDRLTSSGFATAQIENAVLRKEVGRDVDGFLVLARAPG